MADSIREIEIPDVYAEVMQVVEKQRWKLQSHLARRWLGDGLEPQGDD
jgi:hypothetical protein